MIEHKTDNWGIVLRKIDPYNRSSYMKFRYNIKFTHFWRPNSYFMIVGCYVDMDFYHNFFTL